MPDTDTRSSATGRVLLIALGLVVALVVVFLVIGEARDAAEDGDEGNVAPVNAQLSEEAFASVQLGQPKEEVLASLPADPVDSRVLDEFELREPETPQAECVYFESEGGTADDLYRLCFAQDELVDKTVVLPERSGVTGD